MKCSDGGENQRRYQTSAFKPLFFASKDAGCYEDIVSRTSDRVSISSLVLSGEP